MLFCATIFLKAFLPGSGRHGHSAPMARSGMICDKLPRVRLAYLPTPLEDAPRLTDALDGPRILIKRDDRTGLSFGGNKPRIFEYVFGDALAQGCDVMITPAGRQSNHLREVTAAANRLGLKSAIVVYGTDGKEEPQGNLLLFQLLGADIYYYPSGSHDVYEDPALMEFTERIRDDFQARGHKPYIVHFSLRSGSLGSAAHAGAAEELAAQFQELGAEPDFLYVPCGSGVTTSGFVLGLKHLALRTRVVAVSLIYPGERVTGQIARYANRAAEELGLSTRVSAEDFTVLDVHDRPGYGVVTPEVVEAVRLWAGMEGVILDPIYNGRAMAAMIAEIRAGRLDTSHAVVLVHTGGVPALFAHNRELLGA
jgi:1-aminocyclopropane-1-carboxylate deaminase/D-cysteine desulfhydrase-like pyridoxal-dependent ACC family enzyme